jgi:hypothetical protein
MKKIELQALLRLRCLLAVEKGGTLRVESNCIGTLQKAKTPARMLALHEKEHDVS